MTSSSMIGTIVSQADYTVVFAPVYASPRINGEYVSGPTGPIYLLGDGRYLVEGTKLAGTYFGPQTSLLTLTVGGTHTTVEFGSTYHEVTAPLVGQSTPPGAYSAGNEGLKHKGAEVGIAALHGGASIINYGTVQGLQTAIYLNGTASYILNTRYGIIGDTHAFGTPYYSSGNTATAHVPVAIDLEGGRITNRGDIYAQSVAIYGSNQSWQVGAAKQTIYSNGTAVAGATPYTETAQAGPVFVANYGTISAPVAAEMKVPNSHVYNLANPNLNETGHISGLLQFTDSYAVYFIGGKGTSIHEPGIVNGATIQALPTYAPLKFSFFTASSDPVIDFLGRGDVNNYGSAALIQGAIYGGDLHISNFGRILESGGSTATSTTPAAIDANHGAYIYNAGTIEGQNGAILVTTTLVPQGASPTFYSPIVTSSTVINKGLIETPASVISSNGQTVNFATTLSNQVAIDFANGVTGSVTNSGTILGTGTAGQAVRFATGGTFANTGTSALVQSTGLGIVMYGGASVAPVDVFVGTVKDVTVSGYSFAYAGRLTNAGTIAAATGVLFGATTVRGPASPAVTLSSVFGLQTITGTVTGLQVTSAYLGNTGLIEGTSAGGVGVIFGSTSNTLVNSGRIIGIGGAVLDPAGTLSATNTTTGTLSATGSLATALSMQAGSLLNQGLIAASGTGGIGIVLGPGGAVNDAGTVTAQGLGIYSLSTVTGPAPVITVGGSVSVSGTGGVGVEMIGGGTLANTGAIRAGASAQSAVVFGAGSLANASATLTNAGTITGPDAVQVAVGQAGQVSLAAVSIGNTGLIAASSGPGVELDAASANTLSNSGTISGLDGVAFVTGQTSAFTGGTLSITGNGLIQGVGTSSTGILIDDGLASAGVVSIGAGQRVQAVLDGVAALTSTVSLTNFGTIGATDPSSNGVLLNDGGAFSNSGQVTGGLYGVLVNGGYGTAAASATVTNTGTILGGSTTAGAGVYVRAGSTVVAGSTIAHRQPLASATLVNDGLISGGTLTPSATSVGIAARFASGDDTIIIQPGAEFAGSVLGSTTGANRIEIAAGATLALAGLTATSPGDGFASANGFTWQFQNFPTITVDAGGVLALDGANTINATGETILSAGTILNTGALALDGSLNATGELANSGTISGTAGIKLGTSGVLLNLAGTSAGSSGVINVGVTLGTNGTLINAGTLTQAATLGSSSYIALLGGEQHTTIAAASGQLSLQPGYAVGTLSLPSISGIKNTTVGPNAVWSLTGSGNIGPLTVEGAAYVTGTLQGSATVGVPANYGTLAANLINLGSITGGVTLGLNGDFVDETGATLAGSVTDGTAAGTVITYGTIQGTGTYAVDLSKYGGVLAVGQNAAFGRPVVSGGSTSVAGGLVRGNGTSSVLDLVAGPSTSSYGALYGIGKDVTGFNQIGVSNNAHWQVFGQNTLGSGTVLANYGALLTSGSLGGAGVLINYNALLNAGTINVGTFLDGAIFSNAGTVVDNLSLTTDGYLYNQASAAVLGNITATGTSINIVDAGLLAGNVSISAATPGYFALRPGAVVAGTVSANSEERLDLGIATTTVSGNTYAVPGTVSGLGTKFTGFGAIRVETGAGWYLAGNNTLSGLAFNNYGAVVVTGALVTGAAFKGQLGIAPGGTVTNTAAGLITGQVVLNNSGTGTPGVFVNAGVVRSASTIAGIVDLGGGLITNTNQVQGGSFGIYVDGGASGAPVTIANSGQINAQYGIYFDSSVTDATVDLSGKSQFKSSGKQNLAIDFAAGNDTLVLAPGLAALANGQRIVASATGSNLLELQSSASIGTIHGLGASYANFTGVQVDTGAQWVLASIPGTSVSSIGALSGAGQLSISTAGATLALGAPGSFSGTLTASNGLLDIAASGALGTGTISLGGSETVRFETGAVPSGILKGFDSKETLDIRGLVGGTVSISGTVLTVGNATTTDHVTLAGFIPLSANLVAGSDGAGGTQITQQGGSLAVAVDLASSVSFGAVHLGTTASTPITLANGAGAGAGTLGVTLLPTAVFSSNTLSLAPQMSGTLDAYLTAAAEGSVSATGTLALTSNGVNDGSKTVALSGTVFSYATASIGAVAALGATRVGDTPLMASVAVSNGTADPFREALDVTAPTAVGAFSITGTATIAAGGTGTIGITLPTAQAGQFTANLPVALASDGGGNSGLGVTPLAGQTVSLSGAVYAYASASQPGTVSLGVLHPGQTVGGSFAVTNTAVGALTDGLTGHLAGGSAGLIAVSGFTNVAAGSSGVVAFSYAAGQTGSIAAAGTLALSSVDAALAPAPLASEQVAFTGIVDAYAAPALQMLAGAGTLTGSGGTYNLTLQTLAGIATTVEFGVENAATGQADTLSGSFSTAGGSGFSNAGLAAFSGLGDGQSDTAPRITLEATQAGTLTETIVLSPSSVNASSGTALPAVTINVTGVVVANPPVISAVTTKDGSVTNGGSTNDEAVSVSGTAEPGSIVTLSDLDAPGATPATTDTDLSGLWSVSYVVADTVAGSQAVALQAAAADPSGYAEGMSTAFTYEIEQPVACFLRGTAIATPRGEVLVEQLAIGDLVSTFDGTAKAVRWIGLRSYKRRFVALRPDIVPIRIAAGALADGLPKRDLFVSPHHAMLLDGVLIPAIALLNGGSISQPVLTEDVHYVHIELAEHDAIWAEGAASESFVDDDSRGAFQNAADYGALYPDASRQPAVYFAERLAGGEIVEAVRRSIARRMQGSSRTALPPTRGQRAAA